MAPRIPIVFEIEEAKRIVAPETLEDVLLTLKNVGSIAAYHFNPKEVVIWENPERRLEVALFTAEAKEHFIPEPKRKPR